MHLLHLELQKIKLASLQINSAVNKSTSKTSKNRNSLNNISLFFVFQEFSRNSDRKFNKISNFPGLSRRI